MSASWLRVFGLMIALTCFAGSCAEGKKIDPGAACILNSDCNQPLVCSWGKCHDACHISADCPTGQSCITASDKSRVCQLPVETHCLYASDCPAPLICAVDQRCHNQCQTNVDCPSGQTCTTTKICAEPNQVDSSNNLLVPDGGVRGSGGASGSADAGRTVDAGGTKAAAEAGSDTGSGMAHDSRTDMASMDAPQAITTDAGGGPWFTADAASATPDGPCGQLYQGCCGGNTCYQTGTSCFYGTCEATTIDAPVAVADGPCGQLYQGCCGGNTCYQSGTSCMYGTCEATTIDAPRADRPSIDALLVAADVSVD
jgi:hypothetical protein